MTTNPYYLTPSPPGGGVFSRLRAAPRAKRARTGEASASGEAGLIKPTPAKLT